jgi:hypothetical protein
MHIYGTKTRQTSFGATHFLKGNDRMAALLPAAMRMGRLQADVARILPSMFADCAVLSFEGGTLVLALPHAALATRLKQQVQTLTSKLQLKGWDVQTIKTKVQVTRAVDLPVEKRILSLPATAVDAFEELGNTLEKTPQNAALIAALNALAAKRRA